MLKYIFLVFLLIAFAFNFKAKTISEFVIKKEITPKQEAIIRGINYCVALVCVILIMIFSK